MYVSHQVNLQRIYTCNQPLVTLVAFVPSLNDINTEDCMNVSISKESGITGKSSIINLTLHDLTVYSY